MACLLTNGLRRRLLFACKDSVYSPPYLLVELENYRGYVLAKTGMDSESYDLILSQILARITVVDEQTLFPHLSRAVDAVASFDPKDASFVACALATRSVLWSDDGPLHDKQDVIQVFNTAEMLALLSQ